MKFTAKIRRRVFGAVCLGAAAVMLIIGETNPAPTLKPLVFVAYWLVCFVLAMLAFGAAVLDLRAVRREAREVQRNFLEEALHEIEAEKQRRQAALKSNGATPRQ